MQRCDECYRCLCLPTPCLEYNAVLHHREADTWTSFLDRHSKSAILVRCDSLTFPAGAVSRVNITVYDYAEHVGEALAWTSPSKGGSPIRTKKGTIQAPSPVGGQLLYTHLKQAAMFGGDSNSRWCAAQHHCSMWLPLKMAQWCCGCGLT